MFKSVFYSVCLEFFLKTSQVLYDVSWPHWAATLLKEEQVVTHCPASLTPEVTMPKLY